VIVDDYEISGGGIVMQALEDKTSWVRDKVMLRNYKWIGSDIGSEARAEKYGQRACLVLVTGEKDSPRKEIARTLEKQLLDEGRFVYYLGIGSLLYGVDADIVDSHPVPYNIKEHIRRLTEVAHIMLESGMILIISAIELTAQDLDVIKTGIPAERIVVIWVGDEPTTDIPVKMLIPESTKIEEAVSSIKSLLQD